MEFITPLVGNAFITSVEGDSGYKHVVVEELLDNSTGFALETGIRRTGVIEGEVTVNINSTPNNSRFAYYLDYFSFVSSIT